MTSLASQLTRQDEFSSAVRAVPSSHHSSLPTFMAIMTHGRTIPFVRKGLKGLSALLLPGLIAACGALDVNNPLIIQGKNLDNATGAGYLWTVGRLRFANATDVSRVQGGLLSDELFKDMNPMSYGGTSYLDLRESQLYEASVTYDGAYTAYWAWQQLRSDATIAIPRMRAYGTPGAREAHLGELYAFRGFAALRLAEDICPGFPLREIVDEQPVYGPPVTTDQAFEAAIVDFDSALVYAADSARVLNLARLGKARALLGLGRFAEAGAIAADVPAAYTEVVVPVVRNDFFYGLSDQTMGVANRKGGNGLDFLTAGDPRVTVLFGGRTARFGTPDSLYVSAKYPDTYSPVVVANDIEARLIEAEGQLATAPDGPEWLETLNQLRRTVALSDTTDPGTPTARVDLLFRERAFWLYSTGHRLGDLRRLIARYGRAAETVFPTGSNRVNVTYGTATSLPFNPKREHAANPAITGCTER